MKRLWHWGKKGVEKADSSIDGGLLKLRRFNFFKRIFVWFEEHPKLLATLKVMKKGIIVVAVVKLFLPITILIPLAMVLHKLVDWLF